MEIDGDSNSDEDAHGLRLKIEQLSRSLAEEKDRYALLRSQLEFSDLFAFREIEKHMRECSRLAESESRLREDLETMRERGARDRASIEGLVAEIEGKEREFGERFVAMKVEIRDLECGKKRALDEADEWRCRVSNREGENAELAKENGRLECEVQVWKKNFEEREARISAIVRENVELAEKIGTLEYEVGEWKKKFEGQQVRISAIVRENVDLVKENGKLGYEVDDWKKKFEGQQAQISRIMRENAELTKENSKLGYEVDERKKKLVGLEARISAIVRENAELAKENSKLGGEVDEWKKKFEGQQAWISAIMRENAELSKENSKLGYEVDEWKKKLGGLEARISAIVRENAELAKENIKLGGGVDEWKKKFEGQEARISMVVRENWEELAKENYKLDYEVQLWMKRYEYILGLLEEKFGLRDKDKGMKDAKRNESVAREVNDKPQRTDQYSVVKSSRPELPSLAKLRKERVFVKVESQSIKEHFEEKERRAKDPKGEVHNVANAVNEKMPERTDHDTMRKTSRPELPTLVELRKQHVLVKVESDSNWECGTRDSDVDGEPRLLNHPGEQKCGHVAKAAKGMFDSSVNKSSSVLESSKECSASMQQSGPVITEIKDARTLLTPVSNVQEVRGHGGALHFLKSSKECSASMQQSGPVIIEIKDARTLLTPVSNLQEKCNRNSRSEQKCKLSDLRCSATPSSRGSTRHKNAADRETRASRKRNIEKQIASSEKLRHAVRRAQTLQSSLEPCNPSFIKAMVQSHVSGGFWFSIPREFCDKNLPADDDLKMTLEDEDGVDYEVKYIGFQRALSGGWRGFALAHKLELEDTLVFELRKPTRFKVYIFRACEGDLQVGEANGSMKRGTVETIKRTRR